MGLRISKEGLQSVMATKSVAPVEQALTPPPKDWDDPANAVDDVVLVWVPHAARVPSGTNQITVKRIPGPVLNMRFKAVQPKDRKYTEAEASNAIAQLLALGPEVLVEQIVETIDSALVAYGTDPKFDRTSTFGKFFNKLDEGKAKDGS